MEEQIADGLIKVADVGDGNEETGNKGVDQQKDRGYLPP